MECSRESEGGAQQVRMRAGLEEAGPGVATEEL